MKAMDEKERAKPAGFRKYWPLYGLAQFLEAYGKCLVTAGA